MSKIIFLILLLVYPLGAQPDRIKFKHITKEDGLPAGSWCILQDNKGFLWIATNDGLVRYDGHKCKVFKYSYDDPKSISSNAIRTLINDKSGILWIGTTGGGLSKYNPAEENFTRYNLNSKDTTSISLNSVWTMLEDKAGTLWLGLRDGGLCEFDTKKELFTFYKNNPADSNSLSDNTIFSLYEDSKGYLWIGTAHGGLNKFDPVKKTFTSYVHNPSIPASLSHNQIWSIYEDASGILWIGTQNGLNRLDYEGDKQIPVFTQYKYDPDNQASICENEIFKIYIDRENIMWIGTMGGLCRTISGIRNDSPLLFISFKHDPYNQYSLNSNLVSCLYEDNTGLLYVGSDEGKSGISIYNKKQKSFKHYKHELNNPQSLSTDKVSKLYEDRSGILWISTRDGILNKMDRETNTFTHYRYNVKDPTPIIGCFITEIYEDISGNLWLGTNGDGLVKFDRKHEKFYQYEHDPLDSNSISDDNVVSICEDNSGVLWIGTNFGGLNKFDTGRNQFTSYKHNPDDTTSIPDNFVAVVYEDSKHYLWVGTNEGLAVFGSENNKFSRYRHIPGDTTCLSDNLIRTIYEDLSQNIWIGTIHGGLNKFNRETGQFSSYSIKNGLPNYGIWGILEDAHGNLWISTDDGLSKFNPKAETFRNYDAEDGLQSNEFQIDCCCKSKTGELIFGGSNGFNIFYPDSIKDNAFIPPVYITDFHLFNKPVPIGYDSASNRTILKKSIIECKEIELNYDDNVLSLEFAALDFHSPKKNKYAYILEGFDKDWTYTDASKNSASYTNLDPGHYTFRVKGSNNDGVWNEEGASVRIIIHPPWWKTWWFRGCGILLVLGIAGFTFNSRLNALKKEKIAQEDFTRQLISAHEHERKRIAGELHDSLGQNLLIIKNKIIISKKNPDKNVKIIDEISEITSSALQEVREMSHNLHPYQLEQLGLTKAIESIIYRASESSGIKFKHELDNIDKLLTQEGEINLFRIFQESINNILKHSHASAVSVSAVKTQNEISVSIIDNGRGFDIHSDKIRHGLGLKSIEERAKLFGAKVEIDSSPGKGTNVNILIIILQNKNNQHAGKN